MKTLFGKFFLPVSVIIIISVTYLSVTSIVRQNDRLIEKKHIELAHQITSIENSLTQLVEYYSVIGRNLANSQVLQRHSAETEEDTFNELDVVFSNTPLLNNVVFFKGPQVKHDARRVFYDNPFPIGETPYYNAFLNDRSIDYRIGILQRAPADNNPIFIIIAQTLHFDPVQGVILPIKFEPYFSKMILKEVVPRNINVIFMDTDGNIVASDQTNLVYNPDYALNIAAPELYKQIKEHPEGIYEVQVFGKKSFSVYSYLEILDLYIMLYSDTAELQAQTTKNIISGFINMMVILVFSQVFVSYFVRSVTNPLKLITESVVDIGRGNYDNEHLQAIHDDFSEIGILAKSVEDMRLLIKQSLTQINTHNNELELKVKKRTYELEEKNNELQKLINQIRVMHDNLISHERKKAMNTMLLEINHRINTPVGNSMMLVSFLEKKIEDALNKRIRFSLKEAYEIIENIMKNLIITTDILNKLKSVTEEITLTKKEHFSIESLINNLLTQSDWALQGFDKSQIITSYDNEKWIDSYPLLVKRTLEYVLTACQILNQNTNPQVVLEFTHALEKDSIRIMCFHTLEDHFDIGTIFEPFGFSKFNTATIGLELYFAKRIVEEGLQGDIHCSKIDPEKISFEIVLSKNIN